MKIFKNLTKQTYPDSQTAIFGENQPEETLKGKIANKPFKKRDIETSPCRRAFHARYNTVFSNSQSHFKASHWKSIQFFNGNILLLLFRAQECIFIWL